MSLILDTFDLSNDMVDKLYLTADAYFQYFTG